MTAPCAADRTGLLIVDPYFAHAILITTELFARLPAPARG